MKICRHCGAEIGDESTVCNVCGKPLEEAPVSEGAAVTDEEAVVEEEAALPAEEIQEADEIIPDEAQFIVPSEIYDSIRSDLDTSFKEKKKLKKRKVIITLIAAVLLIAAIICIAVFTSPEYKLMRAAKNTAADFEALTSNCEGFEAAIDILTALSQSGQYSMDMDLTANIIPDLSGLSPEEYNMFCEFWDPDAENFVKTGFHIDYDNQAKVLSGIINILFSINNQEPQFMLDFSANEAETMFNLSDIAEGVYGFDNETFGADFADSSLYDMFYIYGVTRSQLREMSFEPFYDEADNELMNEQISTVINSFIRSVDIQKSKAGIIDFSGDVYRIYFEGKDLKILIRDLLAVTGYGSGDVLYEYQLKNFLKLIRESDYKVYVGIEDGKLKAFSFSMNGAPPISVVLKGTDNVWNDFSVYEGRNELVYGDLSATDNGFEGRIKGAQANFTALFEIDDKAGQASLTVSAFRTKAELLKINYSSDGESAGFTAVLQPGYFIYMTGTDKITVDFSISPLEKEPEMIADKAENIFTLSEDELVELIGKITESIMGTTEFGPFTEPPVTYN